MHRKRPLVTVRELSREREAESRSSGRPTIRRHNLWWRRASRGNKSGSYLAAGRVRNVYMGNCSLLYRPRLRTIPTRSASEPL